MGIKSTSRRYRKSFKIDSIDASTPYFTFLFGLGNKIKKTAPYGPIEFVQHYFYLRILELLSFDGNILEIDENFIILTSMALKVNPTIEDRKTSNHPEGVSESDQFDSNFRILSDEKEMQSSNSFFEFQRSSFNFQNRILVGGSSPIPYQHNMEFEFYQLFCLHAKPLSRIHVIASEISTIEQSLNLLENLNIESMILLDFVNCNPIQTPSITGCTWQFDLTCFQCEANFILAADYKSCVQCLNKAISGTQSNLFKPFFKECMFLSFLPALIFDLPLAQNPVELNFFEIDSFLAMNGTDLTLINDFYSSMDMTGLDNLISETQSKYTFDNSFSVKTYLVKFINSNIINFPLKVQIVHLSVFLVKGVVKYESIPVQILSNIYPFIQFSVGKFFRL